MILKLSNQNLVFYERGVSSPIVLFVAKIATDLVHNG